MDSQIDNIKNLLEKEISKNEITRKVSIEISRNTPLKDKLNNILGILENSYGLRHTLLLFPDSGNSRLTVIASRGFPESGIGVEVPFGKGIVGMVAKKKKKVRMAGIRYYRQYANMAVNQDGNVLEHKENPLPGLPDVEAQLALPLISGDKLIAVLSIESSERDFFTRDDEQFLESLSHQMALSIQNALIINNLEEMVTERTAKIERQRAELETLNATKDKFFSIIGHDLKSPVSSLKIATDLMQYYTELGDQEKLNEIRSKINSAVNNVNQLLDNLLNWAMSQRNMLKCELQNVRLYDMIARVLDIFTESLEAKQVKIKNEVEKTCLVNADPDMTMVVLRNVISNAIKYSNFGAMIHISFDKGDDRNILKIKDNGVGMSETKVKHLFELLVKKSTLGTNREKGTGLGMVLVADFMKQNHGSVRVKSQVNQGTEVILEFQEAK